MNFKRAQRGGINVFARLREEGPQKIGRTKPAEDVDANAEPFEKLVAIKPTDFEKGKGWMPEKDRRVLIPDQRDQIGVVGERPAPDFLESSSGGGGGGTFVSDVTWNGTGLTITYSDGTDSTIDFIECP